MTSELYHSSKLYLNGLKRKLVEVDQSNETVGIQKNTGNKKEVHDGYSWWTCLTMGLPIEKSRPHSVSKQPQGQL